MVRFENRRIVGIVIISIEDICFFVFILVYYCKEVGIVVGWELKQEFFVKLFVVLIIKCLKVFVILFEKGDNVCLLIVVEVGSGYVQGFGVLVKFMFGVSVIVLLFLLI